MKGGEKMIESNNFNLKQIEAIAQELTKKYSSNIQLYWDDKENEFILQCNRNAQLNKITEDAIKALKEAFLLDLTTDCTVDCGYINSNESIETSPNMQACISLRYS